MPKKKGGYYLDDSDTRAPTSPEDYKQRGKEKEAELKKEEEIGFCPYDADDLPEED